VTDDISQKCLELYHQASKRGGSGGFYSSMGQRTAQELWYQKKAEKACAEENCIKTMIVSSSKLVQSSDLIFLVSFSCSSVGLFGFRVCLGYVLPILRYSIQYTTEFV